MEQHPQGKEAHDQAKEASERVVEVSRSLFNYSAAIIGYLAANVGSIPSGRGIGSAAVALFFGIAIFLHAIAALVSMTLQSATGFALAQSVDGHSTVLQSYKGLRWQRLSFALGMLSVLAIPLLGRSGQQALTFGLLPRASEAGAESAVTRIESTDGSMNTEEGGRVHVASRSAPLQVPVSFVNDGSPVRISGREEPLSIRITADEESFEKASRAVAKSVTMAIKDASPIELKVTGGGISYGVTPTTSGNGDYDGDAYGVPTE